MRKDQGLKKVATDLMSLETQKIHVNSHSSRLTRMKKPLYSIKKLLISKLGQTLKQLAESSPKKYKN